MGRPKKINPCKMKGRLAGRQDPGRSYDVGKDRLTIGCCECAVPFLAFGSTDDKTRLSYAMKLGPGQAPRFVPAVLAVDGDSSLIVVPCAETFLKPTSKGTRHYKQALRDNTKFKGCEPIERQLVEERRIIYESTEILGRYEDSMVTFTRKEVPELFEPTSEEDGPPKLVDFEEERLLGFDRQYSEAAPALAMTEEPGFASDDKTADVRKKEKWYREFWASLTKPQKQAVKAVYTNNKKGLTKVQVAKKLGIRADSLQERLDGALKKLRKFAGDEAERF